ncbi:MAG: helix-turn-helix transcriptional regulator [Candidatus Omnitrophica bacterium]|nr:helix-turn-helix transcriptional regulator [Candidatus Omnitrophota bacterium]
MQVGSQIKKFRNLRKMSLLSLAKASGVQIATLSRIENGKMTGTLESHLNVAKSLGIDIAELYQNLQPEELLTASPTESFEPTPAADTKVLKEILTKQVSTKKMLPLLMKIEGKTKTSEEAQLFGAERFIFVLSGTVCVHVKNQKVQLTENMSLYFNAMLPHFFENPSDTPVKFLSIATPVNL